MLFGEERQQDGDPGDRMGGECMALPADVRRGEEPERGRGIGAAGNVGDGLNNHRMQGKERCCPGHRE